mgnify:CR=1 FL=1
MALDKESVIIVGVFFGLTLLSMGLMGLGVNVGTWYPLMAGLFTGLVLISQVGVKIFWPLHKITKLTWMQGVSIGLALLNIANAALSLLPLGVEPLSVTAAGALMVASAIWFFVELFSQTA